MVATLFAKSLWHTDFTQTMNSYQQQYVENYEERR